MYIDESFELQAVMGLLESGHFNQFEPGIFNDIINSMKSSNDLWMTLADFHSYITVQDKVAKAYQDRAEWTRKSIINTARSGPFSTDRTMQEYNRDIWKLTPITSQS
jgi:starch phosphorylase